jgi:transcriptional regulator with XRE-family HTH domain
MTTGQKIKDARKAQGMSAEELAAKCKPPMSAAHVYNIESGKFQPRIDTLQKIAKALGLDWKTLA